MQLSALYRYPVKSCRAESLSSAQVDALGLPFDRQWMIIDQDARMITGRDEGQLVQLHVEVAPDALVLNAPGQPVLRIARDVFTQRIDTEVWRTQFQAWAGSVEADVWLTNWLGHPARLLHIGTETQRRIKRRPELPVAFADSYPILLASEDSLAQLSGWVGRPLEMTRFRPNIVVQGFAPFAEDGWKRLAIGDAIFTVEKPCVRCVFTTLDPLTGERSSDQEPLRSLAKHRNSPDGVLFGMNLIVERPGRLAVGMPVEVLA